jgi:hypothetical protein
VSEKRLVLMADRGHQNPYYRILTTEQLEQARAGRAHIVKDKPLDAALAALGNDGLAALLDEVNDAFTTGCHCGHNSIDGGGGQ